MQIENNNKIPEVLAHMSSLLQGTIPCREQQLTSAVLLALCIPTKQVGFDHLQHAICAYRSDPTQMITKELYPTVAAVYNGRVTVPQIERSIRTAIDQGWHQCDSGVWNLYFPSCAESAPCRPSNAEFISRLARLIDLWMDLHAVAE